MKLVESKVLFSAGGLKSPRAVRAPMIDGWLLQFEVNRGRWVTESLIAKSGKVRIFKRVEAAISVLDDIGFSDITISFK